MVDPTACTVVLVRHRRECGEAGRVVHLVSLSRSSADQVLLDLGGECTAVVLPAGLAQAVTAILAGRDRRARCW